MEIRIILRGSLSGVVAGILGFGFAKVFAEPVIDKAIAYESGRDDILSALNKAACRVVAPDGPEIFSRTIQSTIGIATGIIAFSAAIGALADPARPRRLPRPQAGPADRRARRGAAVSRGVPRGVRGADRAARAAPRRAGTSPRAGSGERPRAGAGGIRAALTALVRTTQWDDSRVLDDLTVLNELAGLGPFFAVASHPPGAAPVPPWRPVSELTAPSRALRGRIGAVRAALAARGGLAADEIEPRVAASAVHLGLAARLTAPVIGAAVLRCPLDLRPGGLWWQDGTGGPVPLSVPAPSADGTSQEERDQLLFDELLVPVTAALARLVPLASRVLWGNVASAVNAAAAQVARQRPDLGHDAWEAAGRLFANPWLRAERNPPGPAFRRSSCCLFYRLAPGTPAAVCGDCVLAGRGKFR